MTLTTLLLELALIRLLDVLWYPNFTYMVITMAILAFGLASVYTSVRPFVAAERAPQSLFRLSLFFSLFTLALYPALNLVTFDFENIGSDPLGSATSFIIIYVFLAIPFFICGVILTTIFSIHDRYIQKLYFWDLMGASIGSVILIPLLPKIGPAGAIFVSAGLGALAAVFFANSRTRIALAAAVAVVPFARWPAAYSRRSSGRPLPRYRPHCLPHGPGRSE